MKTSESESNGRHCPGCGTAATIDRKKRGFVRHKVPPPKGSACAQNPYGCGEKD
jgi:hypothetical protein